MATPPPVAIALPSFVVIEMRYTTSSSSEHTWRYCAKLCVSYQREPPSWGWEEDHPSGHTHDTARGRSESASKPDTTEPTYADMGTSVVRGFGNHLDTSSSSSTGREGYTSERFDSYARW